MVSGNTWLILGVLFVLAEVIVLPGIGFLFAGLAAILLGGLVSLELLTVSSLSEQLVYFLVLTAIWWVVLWSPLKRFTKKTASGSYENLVGTYGEVDDERDLTVGKIGHVKWSGAKMRARIRPDSSTERIKHGETVWVHAQKDGVLLVDTNKPNNN